MNDYAKRSLTDEDLIPCTEELNRLKEFLANLKPAVLPGPGNWVVRLNKFGRPFPKY